MEQPNPSPNPSPPPAASERGDPPDRSLGTPLSAAAGSGEGLGEGFGGVRRWGDRHWCYDDTAGGSSMSAITPALITTLERIVGAGAVYWRPEDLLVYEYDGTIDRGRPSVVALPDSAEQV